MGHNNKNFSTVYSCHISNGKRKNKRKNKKEKQLGALGVGWGRISPFTNGSRAVRAEGVRDQS